MEFVDLIPIPTLDGVTLSGACYNSPVDGTLCMTGHHLILSSRKQGIEELWLLHMAIDTVERKPNSVERKPNKESPGGVIVIKCKDFRIIMLGIDNTEHFNCVAQSLEDIVKMEVLNYKYAFYYRPLYKILEDGWKMFSPETELARLCSLDEPSEWRITHCNENYDVCPSYSRLLIVPSSITDDIIKESAKYRDSGRFPVLCYQYKAKNSILVRSSQPLPGPNAKRSKADEKLLNGYLKSGKKGTIIDTRTQTLAQSAKNKGGGTELEQFYPQWKRVHKPVDKHTVLLDSLAKFIEASNDVTCSMDKWLSRLDASVWMSNIKEILSCAYSVVQCLDQEGTTVLVHGSEGLDSTLVITSLVQVMLNSECRTIRGLQALIEREWLQAGYPFQLRHRYSCYSPQRTKAQSPTFLLFLDCLYQLQNQFVCSFEFSSEFLILMFEHSYFSPYGTFLLNSEQERVKANLSESTSSLWSYVNRPELLATLRNPLYQVNTRVICPSTSPVSLDLWRELYLRWVSDQSTQKSVWNTIAQLIDNDKQLICKAISLRTQLKELESQLQLNGGLCKT
uniref:Myotubularin-related protein 9 n=1 Tax=Cacopsylla melanoneura TaxID=428564 RepID=A0A8D8TF55_9HEMI